VTGGDDKVRKKGASTVKKHSTTLSHTTSLPCMIINIKRLSLSSYVLRAVVAFVVSCGAPPAIEKRVLQSVVAGRLKK